MHEYFRNLVVTEDLMELLLLLEYCKIQDQCCMSSEFYPFPKSSKPFPLLPYSECKTEISTRVKSIKEPKLVSTSTDISKH